MRCSSNMRLFGGKSEPADASGCLLCGSDILGLQSFEILNCRNGSGFIEACLCCCVFFSFVSTPRVFCSYSFIDSFLANGVVTRLNTSLFDCCRSSDRGTSVNSSELVKTCFFGLTIKLPALLWPTGGIKYELNFLTLVFED